MTIMLLFNFIGKYTSTLPLLVISRSFVTECLAIYFTDILGTILFMPAGGILCQRAEGGPTTASKYTAVHRCV